MGSSPSPGIPRRSRGRAHRSTPLRGPHPSVIPHSRFTRTSTARARWSSHATSRAPSRPEMAGRRWAAPPRRHGRWPARSRAPPALPLALPCPPWQGGHVGGDLVAGHLADGKLPPDSAASSASGADGWGPADPWAHCQSLCVYMRVQIRVHPAFSSASFFKRISKMISKMD